MGSPTGRRGQIIFLNGTSSSGKSSIAGQLLLMLDPPHFHLPVDTFNGMRAKQKTVLSEHWRLLDCLAVMARR